MIFGHQANTPTDFSSGTNGAASLDDSAAPQMTSPNDLPATNDDLQPSSVLDQPSGTPDLNAPNPASTALSDESSAEPEATIQHSEEPDPIEPSPAVPSAPAGNGDSADLLALKQQALGELAPLVNHLDQSPEEKFKTTMMMLQSTDNQALIKDAYAAAQAIPDDKVRAQALLDVVNEINYFTHPKE